MRPLLLSGYGVKIKVDSIRPKSELVITDGREHYEEEKAYRFRPRRIPYDSIFIDGQSGYISLKALHWLSKNKVPVFVLDCTGNLLSSILPPMPMKADLRASQLKAYENEEKKLKIAYELVKAKIQRTSEVLEWLSDKHDIDRSFRKVKKESSLLPEATNLSKVRSIEGRVALRYWQTLKAIVPETFAFEGRMTRSHQFNASDPVNVCLNYAYAILEGTCRKAINIVGLELAIGFLHDFSDYQTKQSLVYDLQEPYRFLAELTILKAIRSGSLDIKDFYFTGDDYRYRIEPESKKILLALITDKMNSSAQYLGRRYKWDTVIIKKTQELAQFIKEDSESLDFTKPNPNIYNM